jgi:hypothetical protein
MGDTMQYEYPIKMSLLLLLIAEEKDSEKKEILIDILEDIRDLAERSQEFDDFLDSYVPSYRELS